VEKPVDPTEFLKVIRSFDQFRVAVLRKSWMRQTLW